MNYFELYPGDYLRDTTRLSLVEHGAYLRLLMAYYAEEQPLPISLDELYTAAGATSSVGKKAVKKVAEKYFPVGTDGMRHNVRADAEIAKAAERMEGSTEKRDNDKERQRRTRERRAALFSELRDVGIVPDAMITMADLRALHAQYVTRDMHVTEDVTSHVNVTGVTGVNTATRPQTPYTTKSKSGVSPAHGACEAGPPTEPPPPPPAQTPAGEACLAMRRAGCGAMVNASHPDLLAAIAEGVTPQELADAVGEAVARKIDTPFAYAIKVARRLHATAASPTPEGETHGNHSAGRRESVAERAERYAREGDARDAARQQSGPWLASVGG